jgi:hypothetical protein
MRRLPLTWRGEGVGEAAGNIWVEGLDDRTEDGVRLLEPKQ